MARPSDRLNLAVAIIGQALQGVALAARGASDLDKAALDACLKAYERTVQWRRDTTESARREAYGAAQAAIALATCPALKPQTLQGVHVRQALAAFGSAVVTLTHAGDERRAIAAAQEAQSMAGRLAA